MLVLVINCGSSSLKYQLIDSDAKKALATGICENRIGCELSKAYATGTGQSSNRNRNGESRDSRIDGS